ncbi:helix-turn-helix transcriptional regulator, partial [bacterium]|nr:helix-turn-helix transcriptional regulator [bacterium]
IINRFSFWGLLVRYEITLEECANMLGLPVSLVNQIECGEIECPAYVIERILSVCGIDFCKAKTCPAITP